MKETIRATVDDLLDAIDPAEPFDLVATLTFPLPATIVSTLIGVPPEDCGQLKRGCGYRAGLSFGRPRPDEQLAHAENIVASRRYLRALVDERVERRTDDLTSALIDIHDEDPDALTLDEIASICFSLEAELAVAELARRWPQLALVDDQELTFHPNTVDGGRPTFDRAGGGCYETCAKCAGTPSREPQAPAEPRTPRARPAPLPSMRQ
jgi:hypothetical protein